MQIELSAKEVKVLLELLKEHLHFGWVYEIGEFDVEASGEVSPTLEKLYHRLKAEARKAA